MAGAGGWAPLIRRPGRPGQERGRRGTAFDRSELPADGRRRGALTAPYAAVTSIAVIGLYIAYVLPTFLRLRRGDDFERGPWHLGRWSRPVGIIAVTWVAVITVLFMLPTVSPVTGASFNYTPVAVLAVLGFAGIWWLVSAKNWFTGPKVQGSEEELEAVERDLETLGGSAG